MKNIPETLILIGFSFEKVWSLTAKHKHKLIELISKPFSDVLKN